MPWRVPLLDATVHVTAPTPAWSAHPSFSNSGGPRIALTGMRPSLESKSKVFPRSLTHHIEFRVPILSLTLFSYIKLVDQWEIHLIYIWANEMDGKYWGLCSECRLFFRHSRSRIPGPWHTRDIRDKLPCLANLWLWSLTSTDKSSILNWKAPRSLSHLTYPYHNSCCMSSLPCQSKISWAQMDTEWHVTRLYPQKTVEEFISQQRSRSLILIYTELSSRQ